MNLFTAALFVGAALTAPAALAATSLFDPPLSTQKVVLPATKSTPNKTKVTCRYYAHFMVKEVDEGEVGAAQLSIIPIDAAVPKPACQRKNAASEKVVNPDDWSGYFDGVKGDYVFFTADDGVNSGMGFAVVGSSDAKKLFDDVMFGKLHSVALEGTTLTLRYARNFAGDCSVVHDGAGCWTKIAAAASLGNAPQPDCVAGYTKAKNELAKGRCEADKKPGPACITAALKEIVAQKFDEAPSVVVYEAETVLKPGQSSIKPLGGKLSCHPSD
jgi:hypothetical protein